MKLIGLVRNTHGKNEFGTHAIIRSLVSRFLALTRSVLYGGGIVQVDRRKEGSSSEWVERRTLKKCSSQPEVRQAFNPTMRRGMIGHEATRQNYPEKSSMHRIEWNASQFVFRD